MYHQNPMSLMEDDIAHSNNRIDNEEDYSKDDMYLKQINPIQSFSINWKICVR